MSESAAFLEEKLRKEGDKVRAYFQQFTLSGWEQQVYYAPAGIVGKPDLFPDQSKNWRVREVLAHLAATESGITELIKDVAGGGVGAPEGLNIDDFNQQKISELQNYSFEELLGQFNAIRQATIDLVATFSETDLNRIGRHPFLGMVTIVEMMKLLYLHNQLHIRDLRRVIHVPSGAQSRHLDL